jgi:hypothetical protein
MLSEDRGLTDAGMDFGAFKNFLRGSTDATELDDGSHEALLTALKDLCPFSKQDNEMVMEDASQANGSPDSKVDATKSDSEANVSRQTVQDDILGTKQETGKADRNGSAPTLQEEQCADWCHHDSRAWETKCRTMTECHGCCNHADGAPTQEVPTLVTIQDAERFPIGPDTALQEADPHTDNVSAQEAPAAVATQDAERFPIGPDTALQEADPQTDNVSAQEAPAAAATQEPTNVTNVTNVTSDGHFHRDRSNMTTRWNDSMTIESMATVGMYVNVEGSKKHSGAPIILWDKNSSKGSDWKIKKFEGRIATYTLESDVAPGLYMSAGANTSDTSVKSSVHANYALQLWDNESSPFAQWRIQNVAGYVDVYTLQNVGSGQFLIKMNDFVEVTRGGEQNLPGATGSTTSAVFSHWMIHLPWKYVNNSKVHSDDNKVEGVWRSVKACWDASGTKIKSGSCGPTPSPTPKPTKAPTQAPTPKPTVKNARWAVRLSCEDSHGNRLSTKNCMKLANGHVIETRHKATSKNGTANGTVWESQKWQRRVGQHLAQKPM